MSSQERNTVIAIITNLLVNGYVATRLFELFGSDALAGDDGPMVWARMVVWAIPASVALTVVLTILLTIASGGRESGPVVDERDRLFQLRGMSVTTVVVGIGFVGSIAALAWGWRPVTVFNLIYFSAAVGDLVGNTVRFVSYRIGG